MTSPYFQLDKKETMLPDIPQSPYYQPAPPPQHTGSNIPTSAPSPFSNAFFSASSSSAQPTTSATRACAATRTPSHCSSSTSSSSRSCSSSSKASKAARAEEKAAYKAQKHILKDQARLAKQQARSHAKQLKYEQRSYNSCSHRQEKDLRDEIKHQAKQFKHEIKHQCKELKKELKHQHHAAIYGGASCSVPPVASVPSQPRAPPMPSFVSPPRLIQSQPCGFYPQPALVPSSSNHEVIVYDCCRGKTRHGHSYHNNHCHNRSQSGGPFPIRLVHSVINRALTGVSHQLEQQVRNLQQQRQLREQQQQGPTITVAPAPLLAPPPPPPAAPTVPAMQYRPPAGPPPPTNVGSIKQVGPQDPMLIYSMSNMSLGSSPSNASSSSSSSSRPVPAMPIPHAIPRPDLVHQQEQEHDEGDNSVPPPSYEASISTSRA